MCLKYRMSNNSINRYKNTSNKLKNQKTNVNSNSQERQGFLQGLFSAAKNATMKATNAVTGNKPNINKNKTPNSNKAVRPVTAGVNVLTNSNKPNNTSPQTGGVAPTSYSVLPDQRQPSERIMNWATTAGVPTPVGPEMRNVAHGGKRRSHRRRSKKHLRTLKRKTRRN